VWAWPTDFDQLFVAPMQRNVLRLQQKLAAQKIGQLNQIPHSGQLFRIVFRSSVMCELRSNIAFRNGKRPTANRPVFTLSQIPPPQLLSFGTYYKLPGDAATPRFLLVAVLLFPSLFCRTRQLISLLFNRLRTLYAKHRGVPKLFPLWEFHPSSCLPSDCGTLAQSLFGALFHG